MLSNRLSLRATDGRHSKKKGKSVAATPFIKNPEEGGEEQRVVNPIQLKLLKEQMKAEIMEDCFTPTMSKRRLNEIR